MVSSESESGDDELLADLKKKVLELESQRGKAKRKAMSPPSNGASRLVAPGSAPLKRPAGNRSRVAAVPQAPQYSYPRDYLSSSSDFAAPNAEEARTQRPNGQGFSYGPPPTNEVAFLKARSNRRLAFKGRTVCWVAPDSPEDSSGFTKGTVVVSVKFGNTENKVLSHEMPFQVYNFSSLN